MPFGPSSSKNAACGLTTPAKGRTSSSTLRLNSKNPIAPRSSGSSLANRSRIAFGSDSHRGSMPTHSGPLVRTASARRSENEGMAVSFVVYRRVGQARHWWDCAKPCPTLQNYKTTLLQSLQKLPHSGVEGVGVLEVRQMPGVGDVDERAIANLCCKICGGQRRSDRVELPDKNQRGSGNGGKSIVGIGPVAKSRERRGEARNRLTRGERLDALYHFRLFTSRRVAQHLRQHPLEEGGSTVFLHCCDCLVATGFRLAVVHPRACITENQSSQEIAMPACKRQRNIATHRQAAHDGFGNLECREKLRDHVCDVVDCERSR